MKETEFKPYEQKKRYKCELSEEEALIIQKIRGIKFGTVVVHLSGGDITRTETNKSELMTDTKKGTITIATETIVSG